MSNQAEEPGDACPVDHNTRKKWLQNTNPQSVPVGTLEAPNDQAPSELEARHDHLISRHDKRIEQARLRTEVNYSQTTAQTPQPHPLARLFWASPPCTTHHTTLSTLLTLSATHANPSASSDHPLSHAREISSIPRHSSPPLPSTSPNPTTASNHESETGVSSMGHWIYPSENQFFTAMARKGHSPLSTDMHTIVPIHNAVNERVWHEIRTWERPYGAEKKCGGPRLVSFLGRGSGESGKGEGEGERDAWTAVKSVMEGVWGNANMTPRARWRVLMGYVPPFDRHDWVVDRCGRRVDYVIDFYAGKGGEKMRGGDGAREGREGEEKLSFYLDVRPKLNSWEGWRMRASRILGLV